MISKLKNIFRKNDLDEQRNFQNRVVEFLGHHYPDMIIGKSDDPFVITWNENELGLTNLYNNFLLTSQKNFEFEELAREHFESVFTSDELVDKDFASFDEIKSSIFPQLMPVEFLDQFAALSYPLGSEVIIGLVIDGEKAYRYLIEEDVNDWAVDSDEIYDTAIQNLAEFSYELEMTYIPPPNDMVVVNTMDGFDAARILVPHIQEFLKEKLGNSFFFGIPNRDFLICWSKLCSKEFHNKIKNQISNDFSERAYPLSQFVFEMNEEGTIIQIEFEENKDSKIQNIISNN